MQHYNICAICSATHRVISSPYNYHQFVCRGGLIVMIRHGSQIRRWVCWTEVLWLQVEADASSLAESATLVTALVCVLIQTKD